MTNDELKEFMAETARQMRELKISQAQTDEQMKKTDEQICEMKKQVEDTSITLKNLGLNVDGINKTTGHEAEEFFYSSFKKNKKLKNIIFDSISPNLEITKNGMKHEMDIFLVNGESVGIIEVKNQVKDKSLEQLNFE